MRSRRRPHRRPPRACHSVQLRDVLLAHPGRERVEVVVVVVVLAHPGREGKLKRKSWKRGTSASNDVNLCTVAGRVDSGRKYLHFDYTPATASAMLEKAKLC